MKILLLSNGIPTTKDPQFGSFAMDQAKALKAAGHEVAILSLNGLIGKRWSKLGFTKWTQDGIKCFESFGVPTEFIILYINESIGIKLTKWWAKRVFKKVIKYFGMPDIVHAHFVTTMVQGAGIKEKYPITLIGTEHWSKLAEENLESRVKKYGDMAYPYVDKLICVSKNLGNCVKRHFGKESIVVHNLFNTSLLKPAIAKTNNKVYTISAVGSLIERKGFDILINAIAQSDLLNNGVRINIYGKGLLNNKLQQLIDSKGLGSVVKLCGQKSKEDLYDALRHSDLFVLSSRLENFSVAVIEATGNGLPAVATLCGGIEEYPVRDVIKIPINDVDAMRLAIEKAYNKREEADRNEIQKETIKNFSPESIVKQIEKVYEDALSKKNNL